MLARSASRYGNGVEAMKVEFIETEESLETKLLHAIERNLDGTDLRRILPGRGDQVVVPGSTEVRQVVALRWIYRQTDLEKVKVLLEPLTRDRRV
jgi:hypothetical protein